jgi:glycosyltransferase involved in cell wall biosynthesis
MSPLVSIIIPCYNAARWVSEAIVSCLEQTYQPIEIIVIDDGSTDNSLSTLDTYREKITLETGPNRGGNHARNRGFALSHGAFIQFLDADDYLLPDKITRQAHFLEETGADVVYGDWRHQFHEPDGRVWQDDVHVSGDQSDVLASLLAGWWVAPVGLLWRRQAVTASGGWDEALGAGQDRDFFLSVALAGADIRYQPGCHSIYRRYGNVTVSTHSRKQWLDNHLRILQKMEGRLKETNRWIPAYRQPLAQSYFHLTRNYYGRDRVMHRRLYQKVKELDPHFSPGESAIYNAAYRYLGFEAAERLAGVLRQIRKHRGQS